MNQTQAFGLLVIYCLIYVLPLYSFSATRPHPKRLRDEPASIRARILVVTISTTFCLLATFFQLSFSSIPKYVAKDEAEPSGFDGHHTAADYPLHMMGLWPIGIVEAGQLLLLTAVLFAAPLYEFLVVDGGWQRCRNLDFLTCVWKSLPMFRNLVAAPVTEELLFRSAAVPLLLIANVSTPKIVSASPLVFGLAHVHHFYEFRLTNPGTPKAVAIARSALQLTYTSLFGAYATFLLLRSGSIVAVIFVHAFCNFMGLPRFWGRLEPYWYPYDPRASGDKKGQTWIWTGVYYVLLVGGLATWWKLLLPLTHSQMSLIKT